MNVKQPKEENEDDDEEKSGKDIQAFPTFMNALIPWSCLKDTGPSQH